MPCGTMQQLLLSAIAMPNSTTGENAVNTLTRSLSTPNMHGDGRHAA